MSMGVVLGLFVVQAGGHLAFVFSLTGPADPVRVCLHFLTFLFYTAATMGCVLIYAVMIYDGTGVENQVRQMPDRAWEARCSGLFDRSSRMFAFVLTGVPWHRYPDRPGNPGPGVDVPVPGYADAEGCRIDGCMHPDHGNPCFFPVAGGGGTAVFMDRFLAAKGNQPAAPYKKPHPDAVQGLPAGGQALDGTGMAAGPGK
jgi:hypothetical protein